MQASCRQRHTCTHTPTKRVLRLEGIAVSVPWFNLACLWTNYMVMLYILSILDAWQIHHKLHVNVNMLLVILTILGFINNNQWAALQSFSPTVQSLMLVVPLSGLYWKVAAVWSWTAGTDQMMSQWSTTATHSPLRSSSRTRSKPSRSMPSRCV